MSDHLRCICIGLTSYEDEEYLINNKRIDAERCLTHEQVITPKVFLRVQEEQGAFTVRFLMRI